MSAEEVARYHAGSHCWVWVVVVIDVATGRPIQWSDAKRSEADAKAIAADYAAEACEGQEVYTLRAAMSWD